MKKHLSRKVDRQGVVLFMVVAIVLMMTLLTYAFLISMRTQNLAASQAGDQLQARQAAFSAREIVCGYLEDSLAQRHAVGGLQNNEFRFKDIKLLIQGEEEDEFTPRAIVFTDLNGLQFGVRNESAKINLRTLLELDSSNPGWGRTSLLRIPGMTEVLADHILDWIDSDDEPREFGAESEFYLEEFGYRPRNGIPHTLQELTKIPDIHRETLFGGKRNLSSQEDSLAAEEAMRPWSEFLTVRSAERNETYEGFRRINLNSADLFELHTSLVELINVETANFVVLSRQFGLVSSSSTLTEIDSTKTKSPSEYPVDLTVEAQFEFESILDVIGGVVKIGEESEDPDSLTIIKSPFDQAENYDDLLVSFLDGTATSDEKVFSGRVNIMLAPTEVLLSIPGIDEELATQIISNRESVKNSSKNCFWLLENRLVNMEQMKAIFPHVTNRGEVCRFDYAGWSHSTLAPVAFSALVDATGDSAKLITNQKISDTKFLSTIFTEQNVNR